MHIDMEMYRVFYITAKHGSLSKAAKELFISQPAVTQTIKQLEEKLGGQLFFRTSKGVRLTGDGEALLPFVEQQSLFNLIQTARNLTVPYNGHNVALSTACPITISTYQCPSDVTLDQGYIGNGSATVFD